MSFVREYQNRGYLAEDRKLLILRAAVGGTGFLDNHWKLTDDLYLRMMEMIRTALSLNPENRLVAFLWHQGETDATNHASFDVHYNHLPFVAGDFVQHWKNDNIEICIPVVEAIHAVCRDIKCGAFVETEGLLSNAQELHRDPLGWYDPIHFSRKAIYELGRRYFEAFVSVAGH